MEVQDGFIVGIDSYCDRWCETCALTSWCRAFADRATLEAGLDSTLRAIVDAPPLPQEVPPPPPQWMQELIDEMNRIANDPVLAQPLDRPVPTVATEHEPVEARGMAYGDRVDRWLENRGFNSTHGAGDPRSIIRWFQYSISAKMHRAFMGLAHDDPDERDWAADHDGSAKVALIGIERSHAAWLHVVETGLASPAEIGPFIADLIWLSDELERVFPGARAFVRPGFDEPDEVAKLLAAERAR